MRQELRFVIKGIEIAAVQWGNPAGEKVLALHGWLDNAASFEKLAPLLSDCCVVAVDLPGHGCSGHLPAHQYYHMWEAVEDIELIADALDWPRFHLMAHSMGGAMSTLYAGTFPERLLSLILIEALGPMAATLPEAPERMAQAINSMKALNPEHSPRADFESFVSARLQGQLKLNEQSARLIIERSVEAVAGGYQWRNDKRLRFTSMMRLPEDIIASFIQRISCPVLGVYANDAMFSTQSLEKRWSLIKGVKQQAWFDGGHHLHLEGDVTAIATTINGFIFAI